MKKIYIHVGYHKTSTTFLQKKIFPNLFNVDYLGVKYNKFKKVSISNFKNLKFIYTNSKEYNSISEFAYRIGIAPSINLTNKIIKNFLKKIDQTESNKVLISSEDFLRPYFYNEMIFFLKDILKKYNVEIIISIRKQNSIIQSRYFHDLKIMKKKYSLKSCLNNDPIKSLCYYPICTYSSNDIQCFCEKKKQKNIDYNFYDYNLIYEAFKKYFKKVHILAYEDLYEKKSQLLNLLDIIGTDLINENLYKVLEKKINNQSENNKKKFFKTNKRLLLKIKNYYKISNRKLDKKLLNLDLKKLGYY